MIELLQDKINITLGDNSKWNLLYELSQYGYDFNTTEFNFLNTNGAYIDRSNVGASRYTLLLYFKGDNQLQLLDDFQNSAKDSRHWIVEHPFNGTRNMQPLSLSIDTTNIGYSTISIELVETITEEGILINQDFKSNVEAKVRGLNDTCLESDLSNTSDLLAVIDSADVISEDLKTKIDFQDVATEYLNEIDQTLHYSNSQIGVMRGVQNQLMLPIKFINSMSDKMYFLKSQFNTILSIATDSIRAYEFLGASILSALCRGAIPDDNSTYSNSIEVDKSVSIISSVYSSYITTIQDNQSLDDYVMNYSLFYALHDLVLFTINHLYEIALTTPLIIEDVVSHDIPPIVLAHKYDNTIEDLFQLNNWSVAQCILIEQNTRFKYYIH